MKTHPVRVIHPEHEACDSPSNGYDMNNTGALIQVDSVNGVSRKSDRF